MSSIKLLPFIVSIIFLFSCNNQSQNMPQKHEMHNAATQPASSKEDSLYRDVIALHDAVMPKMGKLMGYKSAMQAKIDSITVLGKNKTAAPELARKKKYEALLAQLEAAEKEMNNWMDQFNPDPQLGSSEALISYFQDQKTKAASMKEQVLAALDSASAHL